MLTTSIRTDRLAMMRSKTGFGGWAHYHFGNCGVQRFVVAQTMDFQASPYDNNEVLQASSSQDASDLEGQIIKRSKSKRIRRRAEVS